MFLSHETGVAPGLARASACLAYTRQGLYVVYKQDIQGNHTTTTSSLHDEVASLQDNLHVTRQQRAPNRRPLIKTHTHKTSTWFRV